MSTGCPHQTRAIFYTYSSASSTGWLLGWNYRRQSPYPQDHSLLVQPSPCPFILNTVTSFPLSLVQKLQELGAVPALDTHKECQVTNGASTGISLPWWFLIRNNNNWNNLSGTQLTDAYIRSCWTQSLETRATGPIWKHSCFDFKNTTWESGEELISCSGNFCPPVQTGKISQFPGFQPSSPQGAINITETFTLSQIKNGFWSSLSTLNFPVVEGMGKKPKTNTTHPSLDLGRMGIWIYKIPAYIQSIKLILRMMPTYTINCHVRILAGERL